MNPYAYVGLQPSAKVEFSDKQKLSMPMIYNKPKDEIKKFQIAETIINIVSDLSEIPIDQIINKKRSRNLIEARFICIALIAWQTRRAFLLNEIAHKMGYKEHSAIIHAITETKNRLDRAGFETFTDLFEECKLALLSKNILVSVPI